MKYIYQVQALNNSTFGSYSAGKSVVTMTAPTLTLSNKSSSIRGEWNSVKGALKYRVYYKSELDSGWSYTHTTGTSYSMLNTVPGRKYFMQIFPVGQSDILGPYSTAKSITFTTSQMSVKPTLTVSNKSNGIRAEWSSVAGATSYVFYYRKESDKGWSSTTTTNTYYPFLSAVSGTKYYFQVLPMFGSAKGTYSNVAGITFANISTEKPVLTVSNKSNGIRAEWSSVVGATSYVFYYRKESDKGWSSTTTANTFYPFLSAVSGTKYYFQVLPMFGSAKGTYSNVAGITFAKISTEKPVLTVSNKSNGIRMEWSSISGATGYRAFYKVNGAPGWNHTDTKNTYFALLNVDFGVTYNFQVLPLFDDAQGTYSSVSTLRFIPLETASIGTPVFTSLTGYSKWASLKWTAVSGASGYIISKYNYEDESYTFIDVVGGKTSYDDYNLKSGKKYHYWIKAYKQSGSSKTYGPWSSGKAITF